METTCTLVRYENRPALVLQRRASVNDLPQILEQAFGLLGQYLAELGENPVDAPCIGYFNMDMQNLDLEIGFPVARPLPGKGEIQPGALPAGESVTCIFTGPYNEVSVAYEALTGWMKMNGRVPTGVAYEHYLNDPRTTPPVQLQTRIEFPLKG